MKAGALKTKIKLTNIEVSFALDSICEQYTLSDLQDSDCWRKAQKLIHLPKATLKLLIDAAIEIKKARLDTSSESISKNREYYQ
jgi:hypothetical protein